MPFKPGNKHSRGRPQKNVDVQAIARLYTEDAMRVLKDIMQDDTATAASRVSAAEAILSRGWGKPAQNVGFTPEAGDTLSALVASIRSGNATG